MLDPIEISQVKKIAGGEIKEFTGNMPATGQSIYVSLDAIDSLKIKDYSVIVFDSYGGIRKPASGLEAGNATYYNARIRTSNVVSGGNPNTIWLTTGVAANEIAGMQFIVTVRYTK